MHKLGIVLAFLVVIASGIAGVLTAKLVQVRNSWTAKVVASKANYQKSAQKIEELEARIDSLKSELFRSRELWGGFWPSVQTTKTNPTDGSLQIMIGTDQGVRDKELLHGFEIAQDGSAIYRGSFSVVGIQNNAANLKPNFRATPDDVEKWQPGNWRWRNLIPSGYLETFDRQLLTILKHEEVLRARTIALNTQKDLLAKANDSLKQREAELVGGDLLGKPANVGPEYREGLVATIEKEEEARNQVLQQIDELRRKVLKTQAEIELLKTENVELVNRLPASESKEDVAQKVRRDIVTQKAK